LVIITISMRLQIQGMDTSGTDFSEQIIEIAKQNAEKSGVSVDIFEVKN